MSIIFIPIFEHVLNEGSKDVALIILCFLVNFFFFVELCWKNYAFGFRRAWLFAPLSIKVEYIVQVFNMGYLIDFIIMLKNKEPEHSAIIHYLNLVILVRTTRLTMFLGEFAVWKNFVRSLKALSKPFINLSVTMYSLLLLYSAVGSSLFGGVINTNSIVTIVAAS